MGAEYKEISFKLIEELFSAIYHGYPGSKCEPYYDILKRVRIEKKVLEYESEQWERKKDKLLYDEKRRAAVLDNAGKSVKIFKNATF